MRILLSMIILLLAGPVGATAQIPDSIVVDGKKSGLFTEPFVEYLREHRDDIPKLQRFVRGSCSASWRGFQAHWEIKQQRLFLTALFGNPCSEKPTPIPVTSFFPNAKGAVHAIWYSGKLVIPQGRRVQYVHMGYASEYEQYLVITVKQGLVTSTEVTSSRP